jgi:uncharacterized membrane protein YhaH (DUF805 family)
MVTFKEATVMGMKNALDFKGVSARPEYWWFALASFLIGTVLAVLTGTLPQLGILVFPLQIWLALAGLSLAFRRVRDAGGSVWWLIAGLACATFFLAALVPIAMNPAREIGAATGTLMLALAAGYVGSSLVAFVYTLMPTKDGASE